MFLESAKYIFEDLQRHKRAKSTLQLKYIEERLQSSVQSYYDQLNKSSYYLANNSKRKRKCLMKELNRIDD